MAQQLTFYFGRTVSVFNKMSLARNIIIRQRHTHTHTALSVAKVTPVTVKDVNRHLLDMVMVESSRSSPADKADEFLPIRNNQQECPVRSMKDSYQEVIIPLGQDHVERQKYINFLGGLRFGRILEDLDTCAWWLCHIHNQDPASHGRLLKSRLSTVTAGVDRIELFDDNAAISPTKDVKLCGHVTWVGRSSMEVTMVVEQEHEGVMQEKLAARFLMAARNPETQQAAIVNQLKPVGELEERLFQAGETNKRQRIEEASKSLLKTVPNEEERNVIHELFQQTVDIKSGTFRVSPPKNTVWMSDTKLKNIILCHPEQRNAYNKIFGGFLMRQAFELAWANAALYCKSRPKITVVDDIVFRKPVEIGSLLLLSSKIVYTKESMVQVNVHASTVNPLTSERDTTNVFHFSFESKVLNLPQVLPHTYAEAMLYLDGMRHF